MMLSGKQSPASAEIGPLGPGFFMSNPWRSAPLKAATEQACDG
jgi:hypothetical protein